MRRPSSTMSMPSSQALLHNFSMSATPISGGATPGATGVARQEGGRFGNKRLPPEVNRVLYVRNLPFKITAEEMYDIFGKYGAIRQIRLGDKQDTRGTAFVIYEDIYDAKNAVDHLSGFNVCGRYLVVLYYQVSKTAKVQEKKAKEAELDAYRLDYSSKIKA